MTRSADSRDEHGSRGETDNRARRNTPSQSALELRRLAAAVLLALSLTTLDAYVFHLLGIQTATEFVTKTVINTLGCYAGYTIVARFNQTE